MKERINNLTNESIALLMQLIRTPSFSGNEEAAAELVVAFFNRFNVSSNRLQNNVWVVNKEFDGAKPTIVLNSHLDTVRPNSGYTRDPYEPLVAKGKLFGLGSTDAGASLVSLLAAFLFFYEEIHLPYNLVFVASAEEEISGANGMELLMKETFFKKVCSHKKSFAVVGEPTQLQLAIAEKGLLVLDCMATGKPGHAARDEGENALYKAMEDINWFRSFQFEKISPLLGPVKMSVTSIQTENKAHNVVPASCSFVVDVRVTDAYQHEEILQIIQHHVQSQVQPRSMRLRASSIDEDHPAVVAGKLLGKKSYGSPTTSDQALIPMPSLKCGPGFSAQSHSANEFVELEEIHQAVLFYIEWLNSLFQP